MMLENPEKEKEILEELKAYCYLLVENHHKFNDQKYEI